MAWSSTEGWKVVTPADVSGAANFLANNAFSAFVAVWFMYKTNGKMDRLARAILLLTRVIVLSPNLACDEKTRQDLLREVSDL